MSEVTIDAIRRIAQQKGDLYNRLKGFSAEEEDTEIIYNETAREIESLGFPEMADKIREIAREEKTHAREFKYMLSKIRYGV